MSDLSKKTYGISAPQMMMPCAWHFAGSRVMQI